MAGWLKTTREKLMKLQYSLTAFQHVFFLFLVTVVLVMSTVLVGIIKHIENSVHVIDSSELIHLIQTNSRVALILLAVMIAVMVIVIFGYFFVIISAGKREMYLCASLIKQMEATQQAETKSMNKSLDFASRSHSIRTALVSLTSFIQISYNEVAPGSQIEQNLGDMESHIQDLYRVLTQILDESKIEAGMAELHEEEFDVAQLVENAVDKFHLAGLKKGLDVVLDPCDGSVIKFAHVIGDELKLKEILWNLLSNAVKYTKEGHVTLRAWARKPSFKNSFTVQSSGFMRQFLCFFYCNRMSQEEVDHAMDVANESNSLEFIFEVDDTGMGIPKEKQKLVFGNYVQLNDSGLGQGGTGLGLGNVKTMVSAMRGEIEIVDKEIGEKGTCFRFNVLLKGVCEEGSKKSEQDIEMGAGDRFTCDLRNQELSRETAAGSPNPIRSPGLNSIRSTSTPSTPNSKSKTEGSTCVVLLIKNQERRRIVRKFMAESLGIKVLVVQQWEQLADTLKRRKQTKGYLHSRTRSLSGVSDLGLQDMPLINTVDTTDNRCSKNYILSLFEKTPTADLRGGIGPFTLAVIDTTAGPFPELLEIMNEFKRGLPKQNGCCCKVVWLENPMSQRIKPNLFDPDDVVTHKPLHGTRLYDLAKLLPEYGGETLQLPPKGSPKEISAAASTSSSRYYENQFESARNQIVKECSGTETGEHDLLNQSKPLTGKRFLVAEDVPVLRKVVMQALSRFGATVEVCENGRQAVDLVRDELVNRKKHGFDYILMDCQMPVMDGIEATQEIRKEEHPYGVRIPIIALTAHERGDAEMGRMMEAGMDGHLDKTLKLDRLLETISKIESSRTTCRV